MEKADSYLEMKELIYDCMNAQEPDKNPISYGSHFSNNYTILLFDYEEHELMQAFIACGLFELEHYDLEERIEGQMTYWIYQYEHFGKFKDIISDCDVIAL